MTGLYPHEHGVTIDVHAPTAVVRDLPDDRPTLAELLREAGYSTGFVGKWHLGQTRGPSERGFDAVRYREGGLDPSRPEVLGDRVASMVYTRPRTADGHPFPLYLRDPAPPGAVPAFLARDAALEVLGSVAAPFFLTVAFAEPHHPTILPAGYADRCDPAGLAPWPSFADSFDGKPRTNRASLDHFGVADFTWADWAPVVARYLATLTMLDECVGSLLASLEARGVADRTVVAVTTDHGDHAGNHRQFNKGPLMYEDVYHVPLLIRAPGFRGGREVGALTSHVDVAPTVAELAGVVVPGAAGRSLVPWLRGGEPEWRRSLLCEFHGDDFGLYSQRMLRWGEHKLVYNPNDVNELYDLASDPHEMRNRASDTDPGTVALRAALGREMLALMRARGDGLAEFAGAMLG
jgi:arylsulfatase A-like enzyme